MVKLISDLFNNLPEWVPSELAQLGTGNKSCPGQHSARFFDRGAVEMFNNLPEW
ncbi:MAG: hypothetical protein AAB657_02370 [Patescibacteria group bacterium]